MRKIGTSLVVLALLFALPISMAEAQRKTKPQSQAQEKMTTQNPQSEAPFACSLTALSASERSRHRELSEKLHGTVKAIRELRDGYAFELPGERATIAMAAEWISLERLCCPFFSFQLEVGSEAQPIWLRMTGREGVKQFMQSEFGIK